MEPKNTPLQISANKVLTSAGMESERSLIKRWTWLWRFAILLLLIVAMHVAV
jgi:hypothetical protein